jgi:amidohydrolase
MASSKIFSIPSINFSKIRLDIRFCRSKLVQWRRRFHIQPELGFQEKATEAFIAKTLTKIGIPHQTGIVATIASPYPVPVLAIRSDMDALSIQEENEVPYRSQNSGIMHACGHDGHTAIALGTADYLWHHRHDFKGTIESSEGARLMIDEGVLKNPDVDAIIGLHLWNNFPLGTVGVSSGPLMAAVECFRLDIFRKGGHGAMPDQTVDSVVVNAQKIVNALQTIVSRSVNPLDSAVVTVGELHAGTGLNVITDKAKMSGTVRYFNPNLKGYFGKRIAEIVAGICQTFGATYELDYWWLYPPVINDEKIVDLVYSVAMDVMETPA